jgi:two-component system CheB/CheR fusion protein
MTGKDRAHILIVEDDAGVALLERRALERAGHSAEAVATPAEALARVGQGRFDMVVLDYRLAETSTGLDLYRQLRGNWPDLPAILVTGFSDEGKVIEALRTGIRDVVPKVGDYLDYLPLAVARVLKLVEAERQLALSQQALARANEELEIRVEERTAELAASESRLREQAEKLEAANRAKDHFLAVLSHELRTPLTPVLTTVQILERRGDLPETLREPLAMIRRNVELEARLIDDLLDLTRIARGKLDLHFQPVDVHEGLEHVLEICGKDLLAKRIRVTTALTARRHVVLADPARFQQVLWNLVKNAIKFNAEGGQISLRTEDGPGGTVRIEVADTGVGIDPEVLPQIFDAFEQGGRDVTRAFGGLGLGLAISKALVDLHGGTITATSAGRDRGATFTLALDAAPQGVRPAHARGEEEAAAAGAGLAILLVEDHADTRQAVAELLSLYGHTVTTAGSVAAALEAAGGSPYDLVISDIGLPDGSGHDLLRSLKARSHREVKAICLTGYGMEEDMRQSREAGFLAHLTKPVSLEELEAVLARVTGEVVRAGGD